ncbi:OmpH family outer membrane protein [Reinekea thalattae]|nr:OmpH family outer membrane protein [Reinekea thalattae]
MQKLFRVSIFLVASLWVGNVWAETKIAVINYQSVLFESLAAEDATSQLRELLAGHQSRLQELGQGITTRQNRLKTDADILTDDEKRLYAQEINSFNAEMNQINAQIQQAQQQSRAEFMRYYQPAIGKIIADYTSAASIDLVIDAQTVVWQGDLPDITEPVRQTFDQQFSANRTEQEAAAE